MIKIEISNLEKIKELHKCYFDEFVKVNFDKIIIDEKIDKKCVDFLKDYFYIEKNLNEGLMIKLCYGDVNDLLDIVIDFEEKYKNYLNTKDFKSNCLDEIGKYEEYLSTTTKGSGKERHNKWRICIDKCIKAFQDNCSELNDKEELEEKFKEEKNQIEKLKIDEIPNIFTNKKKLEKHIKKFIKFFDSETPKDILKDIFNYNEFSTNNTKFKKNNKNKNIVWNRHKLITMMDINVCPYCNRQFISRYVSKDKSIKTTADLDHFYSKSQYPFLALSLYNFIPSCQICNSRFKIADDFYNKPHIYPYTEKFGEAAKFKTNFYIDADDTRIENNDKLKDEDRYDINYLLGNSDNFKIELKLDPNSENKEKIENSIDTFKLEELYNFHKDYVRELIKKAIIYNESRIDELFTQYPELFKSREEVVQMVVSNYIADEDLGKRPLAKLTKDICEELGLR